MKSALAGIQSPFRRRVRALARSNRRLLGGVWLLDAIRMVYLHGEVLFSQEDIVSDETMADSGRQQDTARISMQIRIPYDTDPERIYLQKETLEELYAALYDLTRREQVWIRWRYGFEDGDLHLLAELARRYHLSESRAGSMEKAALLEMKNKLTKGSQANRKLKP